MDNFGRVVDKLWREVDEGAIARIYLEYTDSRNTINVYRVEYADGRVRKVFLPVDIKVETSIDIRTPKADDAMGETDPSGVSDTLAPRAARRWGRVSESLNRRLWRNDPFWVADHRGRTTEGKRRRQEKG